MGPGAGRRGDPAAGGGPDKGEGCRAGRRRVREKYRGEVGGRGAGSVCPGTPTPCLIPPPAGASAHCDGNRNGGGGSQAFPRPGPQRRSSRSHRGSAPRTRAEAPEAPGRPWAPIQLSVWAPTHTCAAPVPLALPAPHGPQCGRPPAIGGALGGQQGQCPRPSLSPELRHWGWTDGVRERASVQLSCTERNNGGDQRACP